MICAKCKKENTKCINDMLQIGYVAEIYECLDCNGIIEVEYKSSTISIDNIETYRYIASDVRSVGI